MRSIYCLIICLVLLAAPALAYNVTFRLQMSGVNNFTVPEVNGTFNDWCGSCNPMSDSNNDGIWEATISLPAGYFEYKFSTDNWTQQETLQTGASCTATSGQFVNRTLNVNANVILPIVCWGSCTSCTNSSVTFQVSMAAVVGFTTPYVSGSFNDWCGNCNAMSDTDGDQIWTATLSLAPGYYEYKFSYDNWAGAETLPVGGSCTNTSFGFTNRTLNVSQSATLPAVCWGTCDTPTSGAGPTPEVQIALTSGSNPGCELSTLTFTATATNLSSTPSYQWKVDGVNIGGNSPTFTNNDLTNGQVVTCSLLGGAGCGQATVVSSNAITVVRLVTVTPTVSISSSASNGWCAGQEVTFTAAPTNGGTSPIYQWMVDGVNVGTNSPTYTTSNLQSGAPVSCELVSNALCQTSTWQMIWNDEFNGTSLDLTKWYPELGASGWGNNEWQNYTSSANNIQFNNGQLHIVARNDGPPGLQYTSARLITKNLFSFKYGRVTGRLQIPMGQGIWPAFWMLGANIDQVSWPSCGEIDVMEHINNENKIYGTTHWNNNGATNNSGSITSDVSGFHDYTVEWDSLGVRFFMDGAMYHQHFSTAQNGSLEEFTKPFFLLLNVAVGGNWPGYPNASTVFPVSMDVDFVRVWQRNTTTSNPEVISNTIVMPTNQSATWYLDADGDGFGNPSVAIQSCSPTSNYVSNNTDCDDENASRNPNAPEVCNGIDDNCNGQSDEGFSNLDGDAFADCVDSDADGDGIANNTDCSPMNASVWQLTSVYLDADGDGFGFGAQLNICFGSTLSNGYATNNSDCDDTNASVFPGALDAPSAIGGPNAVCKNQSFEFVVDPSESATSVVWTWPNNTTAQVSGSNIILTIGNSFTGGNLCVQSVNACASSSLFCQNLTVVTASPTTPTSMTGVNSVCPNTEYSYTIPAIPNASNYVWTVPTNSTLLSGQGTTTATFLFSNTYVNGNVSVRASNCFGLSGSRTLYVTKKPLASRPGTVTGSAIVCPNSQHTFSIAAATYADYYTWTPPVGATIVSGQGGLSVVVEFGPSFVSGNIAVVSTNCSGTSGFRYKAVSKKALPGTVGLISGLGFGACSTQINTYTVPAIPNTDSYVWTAPANATIISGQGTTSVNVAFDPAYTTGQLIVRGVNCSGTSALVIPFGIVNSTSVPGVINGPLNGVCAGSTHMYSVPVATGATTYLWTVPSGAVINGAQNGTSISVTFPATFVSGAITVKSGTGCFTSAAKSITVTSILSQPGVISGTSAGLTAGSNYTYTIPVSNGATGYVWTVPSNWTITANTGSSIGVTVPLSGFVSATISVAAQNACGLSATRALTLTGAPGAVGLISGNNVVCDLHRLQYYTVEMDQDLKYKWHVSDEAEILEGQGTNSVLIELGNRASVITVTTLNQLGELGGEISLNVQTMDCEEMIDAPSIQLQANIEDDSKLLVYPNPVLNMTYLVFNSTENGDTQVYLTNALGQIIWRKITSAVEGTNNLEIDMQGLAPGLYHAHVVEPHNSRSVIVVKQ